MKTSNHRVVALALLLGIVAFGRQVHAQSTGTQQIKCYSVVEQALQVVGRIQKGLLRSEVEKEFVIDGGLFSRQQTRYSLRECPEIKVDITFVLDKAVNSFAEGSPNDAVGTVSKPYLEYTMKD